MYRETEMIARIRDLAIQHCETAMEFGKNPFSPRWQNNDRPAPMDFLRMHILFKDELNHILYRLGVDCYSSPTHRKRALRRGGLNPIWVRAKPDFGSRKNVQGWYIQIVQGYQDILQMGQLPPFMESKMLIHLADMQAIWTLINKGHGKNRVAKGSLVLGEQKNTLIGISGNLKI